MAIEQPSSTNGIAKEINSKKKIYIYRVTNSEYSKQNRKVNKFLTTEGVYITI